MEINKNITAFIILTCTYLFSACTGNFSMDMEKQNEKSVRSDYIDPVTGVEFEYCLADIDDERQPNHEVWFQFSSYSDLHGPQYIVNNTDSQGIIWFELDLDKNLYEIEIAIENLQDIAQYTRMSFLCESWDLSYLKFLEIVDYGDFADDGILNIESDGFALYMEKSMVSDVTYSARVKCELFNCSYMSSQIIYVDIKYLAVNGENLA